MLQLNHLGQLTVDLRSQFASHEALTCNSDICLLSAMLGLNCQAQGGRREPQPGLPHRRLPDIIPDRFLEHHLILLSRTFNSSTLGQEIRNDSFSTTYQ